MKKTKYALLDTDFISKTHLIRKDDDNKLIDRIMQLPNYEFYCHMQVKTELFQHNVIEVPKWLDSQIECGKITCYDDRDILYKLAEIFSSGAVAVYRQMLMIACEAYGYGYFAKQFPKIAMLNCEDISLDSFLLLLIQECKTLALDRNLGEIKSFVLLQFLNLIFGEQIYVFCSDDRNARNGVISICEARCISVLSSFLRLKKEIKFERSDAQEYIRSYLHFLKKSNQTTFRIQNGLTSSYFLKVPCVQVIDELYSEKLEELKNGNLRYIQR